MTAESLLWEIKSRLVAIEQQLGLIQRTTPTPSNVTIPAIPWGDWYTERDSETVTKVMFGDHAKLADVYHRPDYPQLPTVLAATPKLYQCLRELLLMFTDPTKALGCPWACFFYNGQPINPTMVAEYMRGIALLATIDPTPLGNGPQPETVPLDETRISLGPVALVDTRNKREPGLRCWQYPDGHYTVSLEAEPLDEQTGEPLLLIGDLSVKAKGDEDLSKCF